MQQVLGIVLVVALMFLGITYNLSTHNILDRARHPQKYWFVWDKRFVKIFVVFLVLITIVILYARLTK